MESPVLRPLSAGEIIRGTFRLYGETLSTAVMLALIAHVPLLFLTDMIADSAQSAEQKPPNPFLALTLLGVVLALTGIVVNAIYLAFISFTLNRAAGIGQCLAWSMRRSVATVMLGYMLTNAISHLGLLFLVIPGLVLGGLFAVTVPVIVVERKGVFAAMGRSVALVRQNWMKGIIVFAFATFISVLFPLNLLWGLAALLGHGPFSGVLAALLAAIAMPLGMAAHLLLYFSLRTDELHDNSPTGLRMDMQKLLPTTE